MSGGGLWMIGEFSQVIGENSQMVGAFSQTIGEFSRMTGGFGWMVQRFSQMTGGFGWITGEFSQTVRRCRPMIGENSRIIGRCGRMREGLRPQRQPTEGDGVNAGLAPSGDLGDEAGAGDFRGGEREAAGVALVEVEAGEAEVDDGRHVERRAEIDRKAQDADLIVSIGRGYGEGPAFGERADLHCGGKGFPCLHKISNQKG